jgi:6-phospho-3-hexuloisomerase
MFKEVSSEILEEIRTSLLTIDVESVDRLITQILSSKKIFCLGAGRSKAILRAFCIRLNQLGIHCFEVGGVPCPPITSEDLLIVSTGSGSTSSVLAIMNRAKEAGAHITIFTANITASIGSICDGIIVVSAPWELNSQYDGKSKQLMRTLFEQVSFLIQETIIAILSKNIPEEVIIQRHTNLE